VRTPETSQPRPADRQAPLTTDHDLLRATVAEDAQVPECLLWDLINGSTGQVNGMFAAQGEIRLRR